VRSAEDVGYIRCKESQAVPCSSVFGKLTLKVLVAITMLVCPSSVQVSHAGSGPPGSSDPDKSVRSYWNKSLVGKPCTTSNGGTGVWTPDCTLHRVPSGPASVCLHMTVVCK
jgi:hypothetical protein